MRASSLILRLEVESFGTVVSRSSLQKLQAFGSWRHGFGIVRC